MEGRYLDLILDRAVTPGQVCTAPRDSPGHSLGRETLNFPFRSLALVHEPPAAVPVAAKAAEQQRQRAARSGGAAGRAAC